MLGTYNFLFDSKASMLYLLEFLVLALTFLLLLPGYQIEKMPGTYFGIGLAHLKAITGKFFPCQLDEQPVTLNQALVVLFRGIMQLAILHHILLDPADCILNRAKCLDQV